MTGFWIDLGQREYTQTLALQERVVDIRAKGKIGDLLLFVEHPPVITLGRDKRAPLHVLRRDLFPMVEVSRGGGATYHGPGQVVCYPIWHLGSIPDLPKFLRSIEVILLRSLRQLGVTQERSPGGTGLWVEGKKVASIGIAVRQNVTYHGFALNVNPDLSHFFALTPCGYPAEVMTSLAALLPEVPSRRMVMETIVESWAEGYGVLRELREETLVKALK